MKVSIKKTVHQYTLARIPRCYFQQVEIKSGVRGFQAWHTLPGTRQPFVQFSIRSKVMRVQPSACKKAAALPHRTDQSFYHGFRKGVAKPQAIEIPESEHVSITRKIMLYQFYNPPVSLKKLSSRTQRKKF